MPVPDPVREDSWDEAKFVAASWKAMAGMKRAQQSPGLFRRDRSFQLGVLRDPAVFRNVVIRWDAVSYYYPYQKLFADSLRSGKVLLRAALSYMAPLRGHF